jgi:dienelactone hydrolase
VVDLGTHSVGLVAHVGPERIAAAGHSLGAISAMGAGFGPERADRRIDAVAAWAGTDRAPRRRARTRRRRSPALLVHGTGDTTVPYDPSERAFGLLAVPGGS